MERKLKSLHEYLEETEKRFDVINTLINKTNSVNSVIEATCTRLMKATTAQYKAQARAALVICCVLYSVTEDEIFESKMGTRKTGVCNARQLYQFIRFLVHDAKAVTIAWESNRNHATIYNSCKKVFSRYDTEPYFKEELNKILQIEDIEELRSKFNQKHY